MGATTLSSLRIASPGTTIRVAAPRATTLTMPRQKNPITLSQPMKVIGTSAGGTQVISVGSPIGIAGTTKALTTVASVSVCIRWYPNEAQPFLVELIWVGAL